MVWTDNEDNIKSLAQCTIPDDVPDDVIFDEQKKNPLHIPMRILSGTHHALMPEENWAKVVSYCLILIKCGQIFSHL